MKGHYCIGCINIFPLDYIELSKCSFNSVLLTFAEYCVTIYNEKDMYWNDGREAE